MWNTITRKSFDYDHTKPEWLQIDPRNERTITPDDVKMLGFECCHKVKTAKETKERAHGKRIVEKRIGAHRPRNPVGGGRATSMDGTVINLRTGRILKRGRHWQRYAEKVARKHGIEIIWEDAA